MFVSFSDVFLLFFVLMCFCAGKCLGARSWLLNIPCPKVQEVKHASEESENEVEKLEILHPEPEIEENHPEEIGKATHIKPYINNKFNDRGIFTGNWRDIWALLFYTVKRNRHKTEILWAENTCYICCRFQTIFFYRIYESDPSTAKPSSLSTGSAKQIL